MFDNMDSASVRMEKRMKERMAAEKEQKDARKQTQIQRLEKELNSASYKRMIARFEQVFDSNLADFMKQLVAESNSQSHTHLTNLVARLDYNGYVTKSMKL